MACFACFIREKTKARSGGTVRVCDVPVACVLGEYHNSICVLLLSMVVVTGWALAVRSL